MYPASVMRNLKVSDKRTFPGILVARKRAPGQEIQMCKLDYFGSFIESGNNVTAGERSAKLRSEKELQTNKRAGRTLEIFTLELSAVVT